MFRLRFEKVVDNRVYDTCVLLSEVVVFHTFEEPTYVEIHLCKFGPCGERR